MLPADNIDDLFRQKLDGHATPPAPDLLARLALPAANADPVDAAFQTGLRDHATPPRRELWERLEDEHLRPQPRRRRAAAWWQLSAAAVVLLMLLAGGGLLWRDSYLGNAGSDLARAGTGSARNQTSQQAATTATQAGAESPQPAPQVTDLAATTSPNADAQKKNQENFSAQATAPRPSTSSTPIATTTRPRRPATTPRASEGHQLQRSEPDAATGTLARLGGRKAPASQLVTPSPQPTAPAVAPPTHANDAPVLALAPAAPAAAPEIIEVEVRRGAARPEAAPAAVAAAEPAAPARRRGLRLGGLLRQADHLVHGESVSLAEATGLPETMTVQARLGGRLLSKTIQL